MNHIGEKTKRNGESICSFTQILYLLFFLLLLSGSGVSAEILPGFAGVPADGSSPLTVSFIDQSISTAPIAGYLWDFGDGRSNSTEKNANHTYVGIGRYNVSLTVTDTYGKSNTTTVPRFIRVRPSEYPTVKFTATPQNGTVSQTILFLDQSELDPAVPDEMYNYLWNFGDGSSSAASNTRNARHTYSTPGVYTAQLQVQDQNGNTYNSPTPVVINITNGTAAVSALFAAVPTSGPAPLKVSFIDQSTSPVSITRYSWDFGDESALSTEKNPTHNYTGVGRYPVSLTITDANGMNATTTQPAYIYVQPSEYPVVKFAAIPRNGTTSQAILFLDQSELDPAVPDELYNYIWNFGDGSVPDTSNTRNLQHIYTMPGVYTATLQIQDQKGATFNSASSVVINITNGTSPVTAAFTGAPLTGSAPLTVFFKDESRSPDHHNTYQWDFGDMTPPSSEKDPVHIYGDPGSYNVTLKISSAWGSDSLTREKYIRVSSEVSHIITATASQNGMITPSGQVFVPDGGNQSFVITPGSGYRIQDVVVNGKSEGPQSTYTFSNVRSNQTIHAEFTPQGLVPVANFNVNTRSGSVPLTVHFIDTSTGSPDSWYWTFGDGSNSILQNPVHTYTSSGQYTVALTVRNDRGMDEKQKLEYIIVL
jgi:PKD repeat protein